MKTAVRYYTKNGGTQRLAEAIAKALNTEAKTTARITNETFFNIV